MGGVKLIFKRPENTVSGYHQGTVSVQAILSGLKRKKQMGERPAFK